MSNRTDFDALARELVDLCLIDPDLGEEAIEDHCGELRQRFERELHNAFVAGQEESSSAVFIVVYKDRHTDDRISVHCSREGADRRVDAFKAKYQEAGYQWTEEPAFGWERNAFTDDDGPSVRIRSAEVEE
jgi:hypothetical protein